MDIWCCRSRPRSATRSASRHAVLQTSAPEAAPRPNSTPYANSAIAPPQHPAAASTAVTAPRPQSDARQHQPGSSHSAGRGQPSLGSSGLSEAAAAAVAQIRRRRATAADVDTRATSQGVTTAAPGSTLTNNASVVNAGVVNTPVDSRLSRDSGRAHSTAAGIGRPSHRSLAGLSVPHGDTAAAAADSEPASATDQQAMTRPLPMQHDWIPEAVSSGLGAAAASGPIPADRAQGAHRPPLPCNVTRRSARLQKAAAGSPDQVQQDMADAGAQAAAANSPRNSCQGSAAGARPVTRWAFAREKAACVCTLTGLARHVVSELLYHFI